MKKKLLIYSLKVWSVCAIISPVINYSWQRIFSGGVGDRGFLNFLAFSMFYGLLLAIPCFAFFFITAILLATSRVSTYFKRAVLALFAALEIFSVLYTLFGDDNKAFLPANLAWVIAYMATITCTIVAVSLPHDADWGKQDIPPDIPTDEKDPIDWRRLAQEKYLKGVELQWKHYTQPSPRWDHDHCEFCRAKFSESMPETLREGYTTLDEYRWICEACYNDLKEEFMWKLKEDDEHT